jgi:hypothetical protein
MDGRRLYKIHYVLLTITDYARSPSKPPEKQMLCSELYAMICEKTRMHGGTGSALHVYACSVLTV